MVFRWTIFGQGLMIVGLSLFSLIVCQRFSAAAIGFVLYLTGLGIYRWQAVLRRRENRERILTQMQRVSPGDLWVYTAGLRELSRNRQIRQLKFLGLLAILLFPFYEKLIQMLMEALVFGHGNIVIILGIMAAAFSVALVVGSGGLVIEDLLEKRAGRASYGDWAHVLVKLSDPEKAVPVWKKPD